MSGLLFNTQNEVMRGGLSRALGTLHRLVDLGCTVTRIELGCGRPRIEIEPPAIDCPLRDGSHLRIERGPTGRRELCAATLLNCLIEWPAAPHTTGALLQRGLTETFRRETGPAGIAERDTLQGVDHG